MHQQHDSYLSVVREPDGNPCGHVHTTTRSAIKCRTVRMRRNPEGIGVDGVTITHYRIAIMRLDGTEDRG